MMLHCTLFCIEVRALVPESIVLERALPFVKFDRLASLALRPLTRPDLAWPPVNNSLQTLINQAKQVQSTHHLPTSFRTAESDSETPSRQ